MSWTSLLPILAMLLPCGPAARAAEAQSNAVVSEGRIQVLLPSRPAAGYFTLQNQSDHDLTLSGASAPDCESLMLHQSITQGGTAQMKNVVSVPVPPHGAVRFAPGAYHLMCMKPSGPLLARQGTEPVTLHFADGTSVTTPFAIQGVRH